VGETDELAMLRDAVAKAIASGAVDGDAAASWGAVRDIGWDEAFVGSGGAREAVAVAEACGQAAGALSLPALVVGSAASARHADVLGSERGLLWAHDAVGPGALVPTLELGGAVVVDTGDGVRRLDDLSGARRLESLDGEVPVWQLPVGGSVVVVDERDRAALADLAIVTAAAQAVGLLDRALTATLDYAMARTAFGRPIGSFQAVKHLLADAKVTLESSLAVVDQAARQFDDGDAASSFTAAVVARHVCRGVVDALQACVQVHGGIGVTIECELHTLVRRATTLRFLYADPFASGRRVVDLYASSGVRYG
jgi:hypothetical protein